MPVGEFQPPNAGEEAPQEIKDILASVYEECRTAWVKDNPSDVENPTNKESCAKISWGAVQRAGWKKDVTGKWVKGEAMTCPDCKEHTCVNDKMFSSSAPRLYQLSKEDAERTGESELLMLFGTAIAEGTWKDVVFPSKVLQEGIERLTNKRIDVEHADETWNDVKGFIFKPVWNGKLNGIDVSGTIFDERVINWYKQNPKQKIGWSVKMADDAKYEIIDGKKTCTYFNIKGIALTLNPACKVCWINDAETVQLSSSDKLSDGRVSSMVDEKKDEQPKEELKEQPKEELKTAEPKAPVEAAVGDKPTDGAVTTPPKEEVTAPEAKPETEALMKKIEELMVRVEQLEKQNSSLSKEKELSDTKAMVDTLISSGKLSEAKREAATIALNALPSGDAKAAFLSAIGNGDWKSSERGLVLSEEKKKEAPIQFSEPERNVIT